MPVPNNNFPAGDTKVVQGGDLALDAYQKVWLMKIMRRN
jgi:hypothetical protein